jgi:hypothetical protein
MKTIQHPLRSFIIRTSMSLALFLTCTASSFAIDQIVLVSGEVIEGKVLADVPNRHVDIQLVNGQKRRYARSQVTSVERDVPSDQDGSMMGSDRRFFFGPVLGGITNLNSSESSIEFFYGLKIGFNASHLGGTQFAPTLSYRRLQASSGSTTLSLNYLNAEFLFRRIGNSGFYFGPQLGLTIFGVANSTTGVSLSYFGFGATTGYDYQFSDGFSLGPTLVFDYTDVNGTSFTNLSFGLAAMFHFE